MVRPNACETDDLLDAVRSAFDRDVQLLSSPLAHLANAQRLSISGAKANGMAAALGVAERMIQRVTQ